ALTERLAIGPYETAGELHDRLMQIGARPMVKAMEQIEAGMLGLTQQPDEGVIYARKIVTAETRIDWRQPAMDVHNRIRGLSPFPGAWCEAPMDGRAERLKILRSAPSAGAGAPGEVIDDLLTVACADGAVRLTELQRAGGR